MLSARRARFRSAIAAHFTLVVSHSPLSRRRRLRATLHRCDVPHDARIWRAHSLSIRTQLRSHAREAERSETWKTWPREISRESGGSLSGTRVTRHFARPVRFVSPLLFYFSFDATRNDDERAARLSIPDRTGPDRNETRLLGFKHRGVNTTTVPQRNGSALARDATASTPANPHSSRATTW